MDNNSKIPLKNGAHIAIVGGGPSGCFFANFAAFTKSINKLLEIET